MTQKEDSPATNRRMEAESKQENMDQELSAIAELAEQITAAWQAAQSGQEILEQMREESASR